MSSQITLWFPFCHVPLSLQPLPVLLCTFFFGWPAVAAYALYLVEGALGAPIFAGLQGGLLRLLGPTGGYLFGFLAAAAFLASTRRWQKNNLSTFLFIQAGTVLYFACALAQLAVFVPSSKLLATGLYPFLIGDFVVKASCLLYCSRFWQPKK